MIREEDILILDIPGDDFELIKANAEAANLCYGSKIKDRAEQKKTNAEDQLIGQLGEWAGCIWLRGSADEYFTRREEINKTPWLGDNGADVTGSNVDIKASFMRNRKMNILDYKLFVRPIDMHPNRIYVLALAYPDEPQTVYLIGWEKSSVLERNLVDTKFGKIHTRVAHELNPLPPFMWNFDVPLQVSKEEQKPGLRQRYRLIEPTAKEAPVITPKEGEDLW